MRRRHRDLPDYDLNRRHGYPIPDDSYSWGQVVVLVVLFVIIYFLLS